MAKKLFTSMVAHCYVPDSFGHIVIIPVIKNKCARNNDVSSYKPMSLDPILIKLLEQCICDAFVRSICAFS